MAWFYEFLNWVDTMPDSQCLALAVVSLLVALVLVCWRNRTSY